MDTVLVESTSEGKRAYKSLIVEPKCLSVLNSSLAVKIVKELTKENGCALDIARSLQEDEQKVYYYLRKLEEAGIVNMARTERRHGMTAKIFEVKAPVVAAKLDGEGHLITDLALKDVNILNFFQPFIKDGLLDSKIIIGDPNEHGRFDAKSKEGSYGTDFALFLGSLVNKLDFPHYFIDTEISESDLKGNLILLGNARTNTVVDKIKDAMPIEFLDEGHSSFESSHTNKIYKDPRTGFIIKMRNPFNEEKHVMIIGGIRTRGTRASVIALTQHIDLLCKNNGNGNHQYVRVVKGLDKEGRGFIDSAEILE